MLKGERVFAHFGRNLMSWPFPRIKADESFGRDGAGTSGSEADKGLTNGRLLVLRPLRGKGRRSPAKFVVCRVDSSAYEAFCGAAEE